MYPYTLIITLMIVLDNNTIEEYIGNIINNIYSY